ncbi:hypothetical protein O3M35_005068 [Rhynocoris fuscipes]|uniref:XPG N-terminal domain-containing protein n=1 Tax=Rhynocoris fuscipes TaxID=488301 RepID=A0AAW1DHC4_9HEMI
MGVHGLWRLIDSAGKPIPIETLENKVLAVDVSIWLYQLVKGFRERAERSVNNPFLLGLFHRILKLLFYRIKPVFVFDGGVPLLKKRTIAARQRNRSKANEVSDKLKRTLLENLAKQHVLGKALGEGDLQIPKMLQPKPDMFYLPPLPEKAIESDEESSSSDDANHKKYRTADLHSIDITSEEFLSLPADMRHDILTELKETRKQNSWAKVHLMPENSTDFSDFQMGRLLKRRAIQVGLEKAEGEMGTRGYTIADIQEILKGHGIEVGQRIAADNTTRFLYASNDPDRTLNINEIPSKRIRKIFDSDLIDNIIESDDEISQNLEEFDVDEPYLKISNDGLSQKEIFDLIKEGNRNGKSINTTINVDINQPSTSKLPETFVIEQNLDSTKVDKINENKEIAIEKQVNDQNLEHENNFSGDNEKLKLDHEILPRITQNETLLSNNHQVKMKSNVNSYKLPEFTISSKNVKAETIVDNIHSFDSQDINNALSLLDDNVVNKITSENNQDFSKKKEIIGKVEENDSSKIVLQSTSVEVPAKLSQSDSDNDLMEVNENIEDKESSPVIKTSIPQLSSASSLEKILAKTETIIDNSNSFDSQDKNNTLSLLDDNVVDKVTSENNQDVIKKEEIDSSKTVFQPSSVEVPVELSQSDSDDDFMEVNENIEDNESSPVIQTSIPQLSSASALEILVKPDEINEDEEDIFADVFDKNSSVEISKISDNVETCVDNKEIQGSDSISNNKLNLSTEKIDSKDSCEIKLPLESEKADEVIDKNANIDVGKDIKAEDSVEVPNETSKSNENDKTADNYFKTKQLNLEEIISLKVLLRVF